MTKTPAGISIYIMLTHVPITIINPVNKKRLRLQFLIDSGAYYSIVPETVLGNIGVKRDSKRKFILGNGTIIERDLGGVEYEYKGKRGFAPVVFGKSDDLSLIGVTALEIMGYCLNPVDRTLEAIDPIPL